jgi:hypothetical protein
LNLLNPTDLVEYASMRVYNSGVKVACVIGDIVKSRHAENRHQLQSRIAKQFTQLNRIKDHKLLSPYTLTLGDEFQAVYREANRLFRDCSAILCLVYPLRVRFSIGLGELNTRINRKRAIGMDGPAFYAARAGVSEMKASGAIFQVTQEGHEVARWVNLSLELISHLASKWKKNRIYTLHRLLSGDNPKGIAQKASLTTTGVYKNIQVGALDTIVSIFHEIEHAIDEFLER